MNDRSHCPNQTDYIIEAEPLVNKFISVPKDKGQLNCASFVGGIIEGVLIETNFVSLSIELSRLIVIPFYTSASESERSLAQGYHVHDQVWRICDR